MNKAAIIYIVLIIIILLAVTYYYMSVGSSSASSASTTPSSGSTYVAPSSGSTYVAPSSGSTYVAPSSTSFVSTSTPSTSSTGYINVASLPPPQISDTSTPTSTTATTTATSTATGATGIYYYAPSPPNITYAQAQSIVSSLGVAIASPAQLTQGGMQGINLCSYGWLNNGKAGLYMQTANPNCGPQGLSYNNSNIAYGIWVYGVVPQSVFASGSPSFAFM